MAAVSFRGNIGKVRGLQFSQDGKPRFNFSVGESHRRFDKQTNDWQDIGTTWWNVTMFGRQAEDLADILQDGAKQQVVVSGRSQTRFYELNGEQRSSLDVVADNVGLVHRAQQRQQQPQQSPAQQDPWGTPQQQPPQYAQQPQQGQPPQQGQQPPQGGQGSQFNNMVDQYQGGQSPQQQGQPQQQPPQQTEANVWAGGQPAGQGWDQQQGNGPAPF